METYHNGEEEIMILLKNLSEAPVVPFFHGFAAKGAGETQTIHHGRLRVGEGI